ncbi:hypothetical protein C1H46_022366 [Malus baccata]|uniref:Uncharacterized protein n=1 Tax=Malus baccata TaxID=106549 RepID=A0A540LZW8_MALBA|nr:hypothetical protein C1H46_022366 [Malus baccata]
MRIFLSEAPNSWPNRTSNSPVVTSSSSRSINSVNDVPDVKIRKVSISKKIPYALCQR